MTTFSDLSFELSIDGSGDVKKVHDIDSISQSIRTIMSTRKGERLMNPEFGSRIHELLFDPMDRITVRKIETEMEVAIERWESRVSISGIIVKPDFDNNRYDIDIVYTVLQNGLSGHFSASITQT